MLFQANDVVIKKERKKKKHSVFDSRLRNRNNHHIRICICAQLSHGLPRPDHFSRSSALASTKKNTQHSPEYMRRDLKKKPN